MKLLLLTDMIRVRDSKVTRHLLFHSNSWDLDVFLSRDDGTIGVYAQILPRESMEMYAVFNAIAVLVRQGDFVQTTMVSARGEFEFSNIPDAEVQIELFLNTSRLTASFRP